MWFSMVKSCRGRWKVRLSWWFSCVNEYMEVFYSKKLENCICKSVQFKGVNIITYVKFTNEQKWCKIRTTNQMYNISLYIINICILSWKMEYIFNEFVNWENHIKMTEKICLVFRFIWVLSKIGWQKAVNVVLIRGMFEDNVDT